ncbi:hypothetical protein CO657_18545 [Rhizobium acidisoli]|uniref:BrnT family toxin n=1 Tax=Rhizobium acidisoli TaxID=1538158 RepID=A0AAE5TXZ4_9HYPH|nr:hypothetical protein [Rhizobium acidisoli]KPH09339.1 hypothetical protein AOG23_08710 [Rhizobium acidisoli]QAS79944.1 hypothetical protein CO657_18545 [Rhizobium acidisoli]
MEIVWDEPKRIANIEKHGLDFADLTFEFFLSSVVVPAKDGRSKGSEALSIISMRPARKDERSMIR